MEVDVVAQCPRQLIGRADYAAWAELAWLRPYPASVAIALVDEPAMRRLNKDFRGKDSATDVLSFPADDSEQPAQPPDGSVFAGDVAVCERIVAGKAREYGKSPHSRMAHIVVHAMLHLQGYRHDSEDEERRMQSVEADLLASIGIGDPYLLG